MTKKEVKKEIYKGYEIFVLEIKTDLLRIYDTTDNLKYYNGYIVIPDDSKFYGREYDFINSKVKVHGGFTFANFIDDKYIIGFDTAHCFDNKTTQNVEFVINELRQAVDKIIKKEEEYWVY